MRRFVILLVCLVTFSHGYPGGAPYESCGSMTPRHTPNTTQGLEDSPHFITVSETEYHKGQTLLVTIDSNATVFKGLLIQARPVPDTIGNGIGHWLLNDSIERYQYSSCGNPQGAVTHTSNDTKVFPVSFEWTAPVDCDFGNITFYATIVEKYDTFYVKVPSPVITGGSVGKMADIVLCLIAFVATVLFIS